MYRKKLNTTARAELLSKLSNQSPITSPTFRADATLKALSLAYEASTLIFATLKGGGDQHEWIKSAFAPKGAWEIWATLLPNWAKPWCKPIPATTWTEPNSLLSPISCWNHWISSFKSSSIFVQKTSIAGAFMNSPLSKISCLYSHRHLKEIATIANSWCCSSRS